MIVKMQMIQIKNYFFSQLRRPAFYLTVELASMPQESLITPHLADFFEQMFSAIPENNINSSFDVNCSHSLSDFMWF